MCTNEEAKIATPGHIMATGPELKKETHASGSDDHRIGSHDAVIATLT
jgi:hypothetical protein